MKIANQNAARKIVTEFLKEDSHGLIEKIWPQLGISRNAFIDWRNGKIKRMNDKSFALLVSVMAKLGVDICPQARHEIIPIHDPDLLKEQNQVFLDLAAAMESMVVEFRSTASPMRKARRLRWELENFGKVLVKHFGEKSEDTVESGGELSSHEATPNDAK